MFKNKIVINSAWIIACRIVQSIINLLVGMLTARYLGPSNYGLISYAASIVAFIVPVMQLGITNILVYQLVRDPQKEGEIIGSAITLSMLSSLLCIIGVTAFTVIVNAGEKETILVCFLYSLSLIFQSIELVQYWFQSKLLSKYISIATLLAYIAVAIYKIFLLITQKSVEWFVLSNSIDYILVSAILLTAYKKMGGGKLGFSKEIAKNLLSKGKYYIVSSMMVVIFAQTDRIMLKLMMDNASVGYYTAATTIAGITSFVFAAIIDSFRPVIFEKKAKSEEEFKRFMSILFAIVIILSFAQSIFMTVFAKFIVNIIYGAEYELSVGALQIVVWYTTFSYLGSARNIWILAEDKQRYLWILNLSGAVGNVILNAFLIPVWGVNGAAAASLLTQIFTNVIMNWVVLPIRPVNRLMFFDIRILNIQEIIKQMRKKY